MSGFKISRAGIDVRKAADYQYLFNADYPSLQIAFNTILTANGAGTVTVNHNLGFVPFTMVWVVDDGISQGRAVGISSGSNYNNTTVTPSFNENQIQIYTDTYTAKVRQYVIKCYNFDITKSANYTLPQAPTTKTAYDPSYGIKVSKYGRKIDSKDLRDFILHSRAQSPALLAVVADYVTYQSTIPGVGTFTNYAYIYENPANYVPYALGFVRAEDKTWSEIAPGGQQAQPAFKYLQKRYPGDPYYNTYDNYSINLNINGSFLDHIKANYLPNYAGSIVVLRDPLLYLNTKQIFI